MVIGSAVAYLLVRRAKSLVRLLRRAGGLVVLLWVGPRLAMVASFAVAYFLVRLAASLVHLLRRVGSLVKFRRGGLAARRRRNSHSGEEEERVPALLDLSFPKLPADGEKVWQVGEQVSLLWVSSSVVGECGSSLGYESFGLEV